MPRRLLAAASAAALAVLAACGVPTDDEARLASPEDVPFGLLDEDRRPDAGDPAAGATIAEVYLVADEEAALVPVARRAAGPSLAAVLAELERDPTDAEAAAGLRSALADSDVIAGAGVGGDTATVDLSGDFAAIGGSEQLAAIAQIVFTSTARAGVDRVAFTIEGTPVEVPRGDGSLTSGAVTRDDYAGGLPGR
ncbi:MAG TPA: GerMN domain-containing protein [Acidimicrobiales bacterium]